MTYSTGQIPGREKSEEKERDAPIRACIIPDSAPPVGVRVTVSRNYPGSPTGGNWPSVPVSADLLSAPFIRTSEANRNSCPFTDGRRTSTAKIQHSEEPTVKSN